VGRTQHVSHQVQVSASLPGLNTAGAAAPALHTASPRSPAHPLPLSPPPLPQNDLSHRMRPDPGIATPAVLLADDDVLLR
jgi:hypothetical protein